MSQEAFPSGSSWRELLRYIYPKYMSSEVATKHGPSIKRWISPPYKHKPQAAVLGNVVAAVEEPYRSQLIQLLERDHIPYTRPPALSSLPQEEWHAQPPLTEIPIAFLRAYYRTWKSAVFGPFKEMALLELLAGQIKQLLGSECQCVLVRCFWVEEEVKCLVGEVLGESTGTTTIFPLHRHSDLFFGAGSIVHQCVLHDDILIMHDTKQTPMNAFSDTSRSSIICPLLFEDKVIGALVILHKDPYYFQSWSDEDLHGIVEDYCIFFLQVLVLKSKLAHRQQIRLLKLSNCFPERVQENKKFYVYEEAIKQALLQEDCHDNK